MLKIQAGLPQIFLLVLLLIVACRNADIVEIKDEQGKVTEKYAVEKETDIRSGSYEKYYPNGKVQEVATYKKGKLEGERKLYREKGTLEITENYLGGVYQGKFTSYYPNGKINMEGQYLNGEMDGVWKRYYDSGELMEETKMANNEENGPFKEYYKNGKKKTEGTYQNGPYENGELLMYNEAGDLVKKMQCVNAECHTTWEKK